MIAFVVNKWGDDSLLGRLSPHLFLRLYIQWLCSSYTVMLCPSFCIKHPVRPTRSADRHPRPGGWSDSTTRPGGCRRLVARLETRSRRAVHLSCQFDYASICQRQCRTPHSDGQVDEKMPVPCSCLKAFGGTAKRNDRRLYAQVDRRTTRFPTVRRENRSG